MKWLPLYLLLAFIGSASVDAKTKRTTQYSYPQVWKTTVRVLRVDMGIKIIEKDKDSGYVLFEMTHENKKYKGSAEVIERPPDNGSYHVALVIDMPKRATYIESMMAEKIKTRLKEDYGLPPSPPKEVPKDNEDPKKGNDNDKGDTKNNTHTSP